MTKKRATTISGKSLVGFDVGGVRYAIDIQRVREIVRPLSALPLPRSATGLLGITDYRGSVIPVIDLRARFAVSQVGRDRDVRWIIVSLSGGQLAALAVDRVIEVFGSLGVQNRLVPELARGRQSAPIVGAHAHGKQLALVLDVERLVDLDALSSASLELPQDGGADERP